MPWCLGYEPLLMFITLGKRGDLPPRNILTLGLLQQLFRWFLVQTDTVSVRSDKCPRESCLAKVNPVSRVKLEGVKQNWTIQWVVVACDPPCPGHLLCSSQNADFSCGPLWFISKTSKDEQWPCAPLPLNTWMLSLQSEDHIVTLEP